MSSGLVCIHLMSYSLFPFVLYLFAKKGRSISLSRILINVFIISSLLAFECYYPIIWCRPFFHNLFLFWVAGFNCWIVFRFSSYLSVWFVVLHWAFITLGVHCNNPKLSVIVSTRSAHFHLSVAFVFKFCWSLGYFFGFCLVFFDVTLVDPGCRVIC